ncbi:speckle targeted PIP5K1A-regulated poly(A) polymerase isoform X2 [Nasonia vitripennis]|nr:speckle targeted PIP5K1A-regulated poly(A) polymerase isoform X2 [Nasonia vitripennis]
MEDDDMKCEICNKIFQNKHDLVTHINSFAHQQKERSQRAVFINRVSSDIYINEIIKCISQFGQIKKYNVIANDGFNDVTIEFQDKKTREIVLSKTIKVGNKELCIYSFQRYNKKHDETPSLCYDKIKTVFNSQSSFNDQLQAFIKAVAITNDDVKQRYEPVCQTLDILFQTTLSKLKSHMFGSTVIGLGFKNSDLDIFLNIGIPVVEENTCVRGPHVITVDRLFVIIEKVLRSNIHLFTNFCFIRRAKIPIIKCFYLPTKVRCDISFKNSLALYNSKLVHYYLSSDVRFTPIMMLIKYWLHVYHMSNDIGITKYAITILFIFYLQQIKLVPPVIKLQEECSVPIFVKGWQVNFNKDFQQSARLRAENKYTNKSIPEILGEFFEFYANYDFETQVLCPIDGQSYSREQLKEGNCLSPSQMRYINYLEVDKNPQVLQTWKPICLQDPIELNNNIMKNVCSANLKKFQNYFSIAAKIVHDSSENGYIDLLKNLFNEQNYIVKYNKIKQESITLQIQFAELFASRKNGNLIKDKSNNNTTWFDITSNVVKQILEKVLNLKVNETKTNPEVENVTVLHCKGNQCLWFNRKNYKVNRHIPNALEKEILITKMLIDDMEKKKDLSLVSDIIMDVKCHITRKATPNDCVVITVFDNGCSGKIFNKFVNYFLVKTQSILKQVFEYIHKNPNP